MASEWPPLPSSVRFVPSKDRSKDSKGDGKEVYALLKNQDVSNQECCKKDSVKDEPRNQQTAYLSESLQDVHIGIFHYGVFSVLVFLNESKTGQLVQVMVGNTRTGQAQSSLELANSHCFWTLQYEEIRAEGTPSQLRVWILTGRRDCWPLRTLRFLRTCARRVIRRRRGFRVFQTLLAILTLLRSFRRDYYRSDNIMSLVFAR